MPAVTQAGRWLLVSSLAEHTAQPLQRAGQSGLVSQCVVPRHEDKRGFRRALVDCAGRERGRSAQCACGEWT